ncbi:hypothetical protein WDU94_014008 [Cyamophila willieti]
MRASKKRKLCLLVTLDVKNAFSSIPWVQIIKSLEEKRVPGYLVRVIQSYFTDRVIVSPNGVCRRMTAGVGQGSILGPLLWNLVYDGVLHLPLPDSVAQVAYADDLAIVVTARTKEQLQSDTNIALEIIGNWMREKGLELAVDKSEAIYLVGRKRCPPIRIELDNKCIDIAEKLKYLGMILDTKINFSKHIESVEAKASSRLKALQRIMPRIGGPRLQIRRVYHSVFLSTITYGAPVWHTAVNIQRNANKLLSLQRKFAIGISRAYRSISTNAAIVLAGVLPVDLMITERSKTFGMGPEEKEEAREETIQQWQQRWTAAEESAWTRKIIPQVREWMSRKHGHLSYHLTQILTGHGVFSQFLYKIGKSTSPGCWYCPEEDDAEHTLFKCPRWSQIREENNRKIGLTLTPNNMIEVMLSNEAKWESTHKLAILIMKEKESEERKREQERRDQERRHVQEGSGNQVSG